MQTFASKVTALSADRPVKYSREVAYKILSMLADGRTLSDICDTDISLPSKTTFRMWVDSNVDDLQKKYSRAVRLQADSMFEQAIDAANNCSTGSISKDRLTVETLMKAAARLNPEKYGDKAVPNGIIAVNIKTSLGDGAEDSGQVAKLSGGYSFSVKDSQGNVINSDSHPDIIPEKRPRKPKAAKVLN